MDNDVWAILKALDLSAKELLNADWLTKRCCSALIGQETLKTNISLKNIQWTKVTFKSLILNYFLKVSIIKCFKIKQKLEMRGVRGYTRLSRWGCVVYKVPFLGFVDNQQLTFVLFLYEIKMVSLLFKSSLYKSWNIYSIAPSVSNIFDGLYSQDSKVLSRAVKVTILRFIIDLWHRNSFFVDIFFDVFSKVLGSNFGLVHNFSTLFQVNIPKKRKTYCPACNTHKQFKVTQYKKSQESKFAQGRRRYDRKQQGFGGQSKPILRKKVSPEIS